MRSAMAVADVELEGDEVMSLMVFCDVFRDVGWFEGC